MGGVGGHIFLLYSHWYKFAAGLEECTNNCVELCLSSYYWYWITLNGFKNIKVFGDSMLIIVWMRLKNPPNNIYLKPHYEQLIRIESLFQEITYDYIYKETNMSTDHLSNIGLQVGEGP